MRDRLKSHNRSPKRGGPAIGDLSHPVRLPSSTQFYWRKPQVSEGHTIQSVPARSTAAPLSRKMSAFSLTRARSCCACSATMSYTVRLSGAELLQPRHDAVVARSPTPVVAGTGPRSNPQVISGAVDHGHSRPTVSDECEGHDEKQVNLQRGRTAARLTPHRPPLQRAQLVTSPYPAGSLGEVRPKS